MEVNFLILLRPLETCSLPNRLKKFIECKDLHFFMKNLQCPKDLKCPKLQTFSFRSEVIEDLKKAPFEELCIGLEKFFAAQNLCCTCCEQEQAELRCSWCCFLVPASEGMSF